MSAYSDDDIGREAASIANEMEALCRGRPTVSVYMAISMMLGAAAASAPRPDFEGMMALVDRAALDEFQRRIKARPAR